MAQHGISHLERTKSYLKETPKNTPPNMAATVPTAWPMALLFPLTQRPLH